jgi:ketosteroid isomerase-like protein
MKRLLCVFALFLILKVSGQSLPSDDSLQVISILNDWNKGWENKDFKLATNGYSDSAYFTNAFGDKRIGKNQIKTLLKEVFSLPFVMSGSSETVTYKFQVLDNSNLIVYSFVIRRGQKMPDNSIIPDRQTSHMRVFQKNNHAWHIVGHLISDARDKQVPKH